jgi:hypothetical protein
LMTGKNYSRGEWNNRFPILLFCEEEEKNDHHNKKKKKKSTENWSWCNSAREYSRQIRRMDRTLYSRDGSGVVGSTFGR